MLKQSEGKYLLVVGIPAKGVMNDLLDFKRKFGNGLKIATIYQKSTKPIHDEQKEVLKEIDLALSVNFESEKSISEALLPHKDSFIAVTCRAEGLIGQLAKIIPHVPYLRTPTVRSLEWATDKIMMRRRFKLYDRKITPEFLVVYDTKKETLDNIITKVGFPLVIKPTGLAQSVLVNIVYHKEELEKELKKVFRKIKSAYKEALRETEPHVLVEQFMDGDMYSIDAFVTSRGKVYCCPPVRVKTGRTIGFDDFFGYQQMTPTLLNKQSTEEASEVATKAIHAVGLRSSSAHVELMRTEKGWKVIELGPRLGGFRNTLYKLAFGIDLTECDILVRIPQKISVPKTIIGNAVSMKFFAKQEGFITKIIGIKKAQELESFHSIAINKQVGDKATFAKNGGKSVFNITLFNIDRSKLLADVRRLEQFVKIETLKNKN